MRVRYYGESYNAALFTGVRGWWIRVLARLYWWLERRIEWHVMHAVTGGTQVPREDVEGLEAAFKAETKARQAVAVFQELVGERTDGPVMRQPPRDERYREHPKTYREQRQDRSINTLARAVHAGRASKYFHKRDRRFAAPDGDFVPIARMNDHDPEE